MADGGRGSRRGRRVSSRTGSARTSAVFDDSQFLHPGAHIPGSHPLRPADSRFSLHEQFALTRREYEFGFDDAASSILERSTVASEAGKDVDHDDTVVVGTGLMVSPAVRLNHKGPVNRDYYELLCLPKDPLVSSDDIRRAHLRLFQILHSEKQPAYQRTAAAFYFAAVQGAFETLIEPYRKIDYDLSTVDDEDSGTTEDDEGAVDSGNDGSDVGKLREQYLNWAQGEPRTMTDVALRVEANAVQFAQHRGQQQLVTPLDFAIKQSTTVALPALRHVLEKSILSIQSLRAGKGSSGPSSQAIQATVPTVTLTGSAHAFLAERAKLKPLILDSYVPPGPLLHEPRHLSQLFATRLLPGLNVKLRQELFWRETGLKSAYRLAGIVPLPDTVLEQDLDILPELRATTRLAHSFDLADTDEPLHVEVSVRNSLRSNGLAPGLGLALHRRVNDGTGFVVVDAGDREPWLAKECRELSKFSKITQGIAQKFEPVRTAPTIEAGYTWSSYEMGLQAGRAFTKNADRNVRTVDCDMDDDKAGSWSVSAAATADNAACYLRYGRDLLSLVSPDQSHALPAGNRSHRWSGLRGEVEFGATRHQAFWVAFRALKRIGRFSKLGFEVGFTRYSLYLSLYWSRLGQRFSLPFLMASKSNLDTELAFWTTLVPFATFAALEYFYWRPQSKARKNGLSDLSKDGLQEHIARRRSEADDLTAILAAGVETRQATERQKGGLLILSAKYGVKDAPPDEVADVTVAVGALVDSGELLIPNGLRKSHLLGFWDPAPLKTKVLYVKYLYRGKEHSVEARGRDELRLP